MSARSDSAPGGRSGSAEEPVELVINWGLGRHSSAYLARILTDPAAHGVDPARTVVLHMAVGSEWPDTVADCEQHLLPELRRHQMRLVQVARAGQLMRDGIEVLDDSRDPQRLITRGGWTLWDELELNGTVPQQGGPRLCSLRAKAEVGDRWIQQSLPDTPFRQVMGFHADEERRAASDRRHSRNPRRLPAFPLIEWGWDNDQCVAFLRDRFRIEWRPSYCFFCCFPVSMGALPAHLQRMRAYPEIAGRVLRLEYTATRLNPRARLFGDRSLLQLFDPAAAADRPVLEAFAAELADRDWAVYRVRRLLPVSEKNPTRRAPALRSVRRQDTGGRAQMRRIVEDVANRRRLRLEVDPVYGSARAWVRERGPVLPTGEEFEVSTPAVVQDKEQDRFAAEWAAHLLIRQPYPRLDETLAPETSAEMEEDR